MRLKSLAFVLPAALNGRPLRAMSSSPADGDKSEVGSIGGVPARTPPGVTAASMKNKWDAHWVKGVAPGDMWDAKASSPALVAALKDSQVVAAAGKRVLVPGCGRGYDLVEMMKSGAREAVGLEISPAASEVAMEHAQSSLSPEKASNVSVKVDNFFSFKDDEKFDLVYDYTFFCAIDPSMRDKWAAKMSELILPGGHLIALIFPVDPNREGGPPFRVAPEDYVDRLLKEGFQVASLRKLEDGESHAGRGGMEHFGIFQRVEGGQSSEL